MRLNGAGGRHELGAMTSGAPALADRIGSAVLLTVTLPVTIVAALAVLLTSPGPVIQHKAIVRSDRRVVFVRRFRTTGRHGAANRRAAVGEDRRVTPVGRLLEVSRIARLPALADVLAGNARLSDAIRG